MTTSHHSANNTDLILVGSRVLLKCCQQWDEMGLAGWQKARAGGEVLCQSSQEVITAPHNTADFKVVMGEKIITKKNTYTTAKISCLLEIQTHTMQQRSGRAWSIQICVYSYLCCLFPQRSDQAGQVAKPSCYWEGC